MTLDGDYRVIYESPDRVILQDTAGGTMDGPMFSITISYHEDDLGIPPVLSINHIEEKPVKR